MAIKPWKHFQIHHSFICLSALSVPIHPSIHLLLAPLLTENLGISLTSERFMGYGKKEKVLLLVEFWKLVNDGFTLDNMDKKVQRLLSNA